MNLGGKDDFYVPGRSTYMLEFGQKREWVESRHKLGSERKEDDCDFNRLAFHSVSGDASPGRGVNS